MKTVLALPNLRVLNVSAAHLSAFDLSVSANATLLQELYNDLRVVPAGLASTMPGLQSLSLAGNTFNATESVTAADFANFGALQDLSLARCALTRLPEGVFDSLPLLLSLDLSGNQLNALPTSVLSPSVADLCGARANRTACLAGRRVGAVETAGNFCAG